jgi:hypothetical protein
MFSRVSRQTSEGIQHQLRDIDHVAKAANPISASARLGVQCVERYRDRSGKGG